MTVLASEDRGDLLRWIFSGALVPTFSTSGCTNCAVVCLVKVEARPTAGSQILPTGYAALSSPIL